jgi:segregation and condensation protein B
MSLKAKLEAVIYAAEEPVTLAQLASLFAADALEWKAEQDAASAAENAEAGNPSPDAAEPLLNQSFDYQPSEPDAEAPPETGVSDPNPDAEASLEASAEAAAASEAAAAVLEAKRQARLRDREVRAILRQLLDEIIAPYVSDDRGIEIREIAGGYRLATKPECHDAVRLFVRSLKPALKLSLPALETLAVIAYKQPVTAPEVNEIRGVDSSGVFGSLLARKLISTAGRKPVVGRPILYKTTREFLLRFGLKDVSELPSMEEFEKMAALELDEPEVNASEPELTASGDSTSEIRQDPNLELDESDDQPGYEFMTPEQESSELTETAGMAARNEPPAEAAPAAPPTTEQAETENSPHD